MRAVRTALVTVADLDEEYITRISTLADPSWKWRSSEMDVPWPEYVLRPSIQEELL
jgi:hypothetical protein